MLLLAGAGLFARSLYNLKSARSGLPGRQPACASRSIRRSAATTRERLDRALSAACRSELAAVPGVRSVSMSEIGALTGNNWSMTVRVDGYQAKEGEDMNPSVDGVGPRFFATMGHSARQPGASSPKDVDGRAEGRDHQRDDGEVFLRQRQSDRPPYRLRPRQGRPTSKSSASSRTSESLELRRRAAAVRLHPVRAGRDRDAADVLRPRRAATPAASRRRGPAGRAAPRSRTCRSST